MTAPLTMQVALVLAVLGIVVAFIADALPRRPSAPPDWDPYRWQMFRERVWPQDPPMYESFSGAIRTCVALGFSVADRVRATRPAVFSTRLPKPSYAAVKRHDMQIASARIGIVVILALVLGFSARASLNRSRMDRESVPGLRGNRAGSGANASFEGINRSR